MVHSFTVGSKYIPVFQFLSMPISLGYIGNEKNKEIDVKISGKARKNTSEIRKTKKSM